MAGFKSQAKRKREQAKLDKRLAKDQKRALRKAEQSGVDVSAPAPIVTPPQRVPSDRQPVATELVRKPLTLTEAVERWRNTKFVKPKR